MTIKNLIEDYGTTQKVIREHCGVSKALVSRWTNTSIPIERYKEIKIYLMSKATDFLSKYS